MTAVGGERSFAETGLNGEVAPKLLIGERFAAGDNIRVVASGQGRDQENVWPTPGFPQFLVGSPGDDSAR